MPNVWYVFEAAIRKKKEKKLCEETKFIRFGNHGLETNYSEFKYLRPPALKILESWEKKTLAAL